MPIAPFFWAFYYLFSKYCESKHNKVGLLVTITRSLVALIVFLSMSKEPLALKLVVQFFLWCPGLWIPRLLVPLAAPRLTYYVTRLTFPFGFWCEPQGGAAFMAALTCTRRTRPSERQLAFVEARLAGPAMTAGGATMAGYAVLASLRSEFERARGLFFVVSRLHWRHVAHGVRAHALEWLAADALEHGTADGCFELPWWRRPRFTWFLERLRARMQPGGERISTASLLVLLLVAPHRLASLRLLRAALARPSPSATSPALQVAAAAAAWEATLDAPELRARIGRRLAELGGKSDPDQVLLTLREGVLSELVKRLKHEPAPPSESTQPLLFDAREQVLSSICEEVEERLRVITDMADETLPDPLLVWGHWASLQQDLHRLRALDPSDPSRVHHLCYPKLHNWGAGLTNNAKQAMLAHDIFRFSAHEARRAQDLQARALCKKNAAACL